MPFLRYALIPLGICLGLSGCKGNPAEQFNPAVENLRQVAILCGKYMGVNHGKMPANLEQLKKFARSQPMMPNDAKEDKMFISPRDEQPFVLVPTAKMSVPGVGPKAIVA